MQDKKNKHKGTKLVVNNRLKIKINGKKIHSKLIDYFLVSCYYYYKYVFFFFIVPVDLELTM